MLRSSAFINLVVGFLDLQQYNIDMENDQLADLFWRRVRLENLAPNTVKRHNYAMRELLHRFGNKPLLEVTAAEMEEYVLSIHNKDRVTRTFKKFYKMMGHPEVVSNIRINIKDRVLTPEDLLTRKDVDNMLSHLSNLRDKAIVLLLWDTGMRPVELLSMSLGSVDFSTSPAHVSVSGKTGLRIIPLQDETAKSLLAYIDGVRRLGPGYFWVHSTKSHCGGALGYATLNDIISRVGSAIGLPHIYPYLFRHSAASRDAGDGWTEIELCQKYGWQYSSKMPRVYLHLHPSLLDKKYHNQVETELQIQINELKTLLQQVLSSRERI